MRALSRRRWPRQANVHPTDLGGRPSRQSPLRTVIVLLGHQAQEPSRQNGNFAEGILAEAGVD